VAEVTLTDDDYRQLIRTLSDRLVESQSEIRVLASVQWGDDVRADFFAHDARRQPDVGADYYPPLKFEPDELRAAFRDIEAETLAKLGPLSPAGRLMRFMSEQYRLVIDMLVARGTDEFGSLSMLLYGSPHDVLHAGGPTVSELAHELRQTLEAMSGSAMELEDERTIPGDEAAKLLQERFDVSMGPGRVDVRLDDGIAADAAAGSTYVKVRADRFFSERDLRLLEAHEGWVHIGTALNGLSQPYCTFLGKAAPRTTVTQEGLAVLAEVLTLRSYPRRLSKLLRRVEGISMAAEGATFLDVYRSYVDDGTDPDDAYDSASRIFRGSTPTGGPFAKDLGYGKGFVTTTAYVRAALRLGHLHRIPMLFCGKVDLLDMGAVHHLEDEGLVEAPTWVPPPFDDLPALASTLAMLRFAGGVDIDRIEADVSVLF
jgi:uncharacterized protein (TIGR02421 family)